MDLNAALTSSSNVMSSTKSLMSKLSDDIPTIHRRNVSFQAPSFPLIPPFWNKMESILQKVGLSTLSKRFADGKIDPDIILAVSESCLMRLGVETLGEGLKSIFTPQTKIYLWPIQKSLSCKLKEKCMWCSKEIPLNEL